MKLNELKRMSPGSAKLAEKLIREEINEKWIREILLEKKGLRGDGRAGTRMIDDFEVVVWDNLSPKQQQQVVEATNKVIEEDLFKEIPRYEDYIHKEPPDPFYEPFYWDNLIDLACMLEGKIPGLVNKVILLKWREQNFPNFYTEVSKKSLKERIEKTFLPKEYYKHWFDRISVRHASKIYKNDKEIPHWECHWQRLIDDKECTRMHSFIPLINEILREEISHEIIHRELYVENLLESCCYIEKYAPGYIDKNEVLKWYTSSYAEVNFDDQTKTKLNELIKETFLKE